MKKSYPTWPCPGPDQCRFSISFDSQAEIDAFPSMYPDCIQVDT